MTVYKEKGKYYCRFQINGERHHISCVGAANKSEAQRLEHALKLKVFNEQEGFIPKKKKLFKMDSLYNLCENYSRLNKKSFRSDKIMLGIIKEYFGNPYIKDINNSTIENFKYSLINERDVANSTVNRYLALLSKMFNLGIDEGIIDVNLLKRTKRLRENNYKVRFLTKEEETLLFSFFNDSPPYLADIVTTALQTGMRKGEILNLKWKDIDFTFGFIEVLETKSGKSRKIPISNKLIDVLTRQPKVCEYVFQIKGKKINDIKKAWNTALKKSGIKNFRFHDLRHTAATRMVEKGIDLVVVKEILGHADISTTMRYARAVPERKKLAIEVLNNY